MTTARLSAFFKRFRAVFTVKVTAKKAGKKVSKTLKAKIQRQLPLHSTMIS